VTKEARPQNSSKKTRAAIERMNKEKMHNDEEGITLMDEEGITLLGIRAPCCPSP